MAKIIGLGIDSSLINQLVIWFNSTLNLIIFDIDSFVYKSGTVHLSQLIL